MTSLVSISDVVIEIGTTLPAMYTAEIISTLSDDAEDIVQFDTGRSIFTGSSATIYKRAVLLLVSSRIVRSNPTIAKGGISSISELGTTISFSGSSYADALTSEYNNIIQKLKLRGSYVSTSQINEETFYSSTTTEDDDEWA